MMQIRWERLREGGRGRTVFFFFSFFGDGLIFFA